MSRELVERLVKAARAEAKQANDVIALNRDGGGQGRIAVATAMHRIDRMLGEALDEIERLSKGDGDEALALLGELLNGPSKGEFYGIDGALRSKLETIRLTLQRAATPPVVDREAVIACLDRVIGDDQAFPTDTLRTANKCADAIIALLPAVPEGMVLVPREPTEAMLSNGAAASRDFLSNSGPYPRTKAVWSAMIAAPSPMKGEDR
jgi:hypothetical protein